MRIPPTVGTTAKSCQTGPTAGSSPKLPDEFKFAVLSLKELLKHHEVRLSIGGHSAEVPAVERSELVGGSFLCAEDV